MIKFYFKNLLLATVLLALSVSGMAQSNSSRLSLGVGALYEKGFDATLSVERETKHHNIWEFFGNVYIKYTDDKIAGHITRDSFWHNYFTWGAGTVYKPCVFRTRNKHGNLRIGASLGSDTEEVVGWINVGYEHNYALRHGWYVYWQVKSDMCINGEDLFRTGLVLGIKIPTGSR